MNMKNSRTALLAAAITASLTLPILANQHNERQDYTIYVDSEGIMRRSDNNAEVSYYGTNYTTPFAYSYRALGYLDKDRKRAIDRDIYHIARLGLNAYRLHLWDAELADSAGNLLQNEHLELLDYMIARLEERGIDIILTAQTNFGNGYPEKDIDTGAFTYDFAKCQIHDDPRAQKIQENYLRQLAHHKNPYTGRTYAGDNAIIAMEINNEPCHSGTAPEVTAYIDRMVKSLRKAGFKKPILYNVSHNPQVTKAYYDADIDGTTYQWYPTGLVAGHSRNGNLLPAFDEYTIPWKDTMPNYDKLARVVYEFDPADVMYSHLYPAVARTFRKEGFQWITQFAYDPIDLAPYNTEYPTHYLNLAYTPAKALSMMVAAEAAREIPRGKDFGSYPDNTRFGHTRISYEEDLSEFISPEKYIYTNNTSTPPGAIDSLRLIAGHGSSPLVTYPGSGAYFLDRIGDSKAWRLEVLPDVFQVSDPFSDTDLTDAKIVTLESPHDIAIHLPDLGGEYHYRGINTGNNKSGQAAGSRFTVTPGVYLLAADPTDFPLNMDQYVAGNIGLTEYVSPDNNPMPFTLLSPAEADKNLDFNMIPEDWNFSVKKRPMTWDNPDTYLINTNPNRDATLVIRRYVADKIANIPEGISPERLSVRFFDEIGTDPEGLTSDELKTYTGAKRNVATPLPEGAEIAVVTSDGYTYSAPITLDENNVFSIEINRLQPRKGIIMPAPFPSMLTREYPAPAEESKVDTFRDIEFVELIIPQTAGEPQSLILNRIWIE